jgi:hypothetical protein
MKRFSSYRDFFISGKQLHKARGSKRAFEKRKLSFNFDREIAFVFLKRDSDNGRMDVCLDDCSRTNENSTLSLLSTRYCRDLSTNHIKSLPYRQLAISILPSPASLNCHAVMARIVQGIQAMCCEKNSKRTRLCLNLLGIILYEKTREIMT